MAMDDTMEKLIQDNAANTMEHQSFRRRLDELDQRTQKQNDILITLEKQNNAIENMGQTLVRVEKNVEDVGRRVRTLEGEPGEKYKKISGEILKYVLLALVGMVLGWLFNGWMA